MTDSGAAQRTVLVTGATGFIGSQTLEPLIDRGFHVVGVARGEVGPRVPGLEWRKADLLSQTESRNLMEDVRPTHLLAVAWHMAPDNMQSLENFRWLKASIDHLLYFAALGGRRAVFVGSCAEYDWAYGRMSESRTPLRPASQYGAAKLALFTTFTSICAALPVSGAWVRPFFVYGPGEPPHRLAADVTLALLRGEKALCTQGRQRRDFLHVSDVGDALSSVVDSNFEGPINVGSGSAIPIADFASEIARQIGAPERLCLGARAERPDDPDLIEADIHRLSAELGWRPHFNLQTGISDTIRWWRKNMPTKEQNQ